VGNSFSTPFALLIMPIKGRKGGKAALIAGVVPGPCATDSKKTHDRVKEARKGNFMQKGSPAMKRGIV
jgi:hypothetical protein